MSAPANQPDALHRPLNRRALAAVCLLCVLAIAPFVNRPAHIDDPLFIWIARHIVDHPTDFYGFEVNWEGTDRAIGHIFPMPPLTSYFIAGVSRIAGWDVFFLHLAFLPVSVLAAAGAFVLGNRFCNRPWLCAVLLIISPAFWVSSTTLMCDTPLLCLWIWAVVFWIRGSEQSAWFFLPSSFAISAAVMTKFTALGLIPLLALHAILNSAQLKIRIAQAAALIFPVAVILGYDALFKHLYGFGALENASYYATESRRMLDIPFALRVIDTTAFFGGGVLAGCLVLFLLLWRTWAQIAFAAGGVIVTLLLASSASPPGGWLNAAPPSPQPHLSIGAIAFYFQFTFMLGLGFVLGIQCFKSLRRGWRDDIFLISWIVGLYVFAGFVNWSINARSILPMIPAACIVIVRGVDRFERLPRFPTFTALSIGAVVTLIVVIGDYQLAATGRNAADVLGAKAQVIAERSTTKVWFVGHWGFQYYMNPERMTELDVPHPQCRPGDYVIFPDNGFGSSFRAAGFETVEEFSIGPARWSATAEPGMGAGFYHSNGWLLPFIIGPVPKEYFLLARVGPNSHVSP